MKAVSIMQPWCEEIARGIKTREYRTWSTAYRGPLVVVSSQKEDPDYAGVTFRSDAELDALPRGQAVCVVDLVGVESAQFDLYAWVLERPRRVPEGLAVKGRLSLYALPSDVEEAIRQAVKL